MAQVIIEVKKGGVCNCQQVQQPANNITAERMEALKSNINALNPARQVADSSALPATTAATAPTTKAKIKWWPWLAAGFGLVLVAVAVSGGGKRKKDKDSNKRKRK